jgi:hypothetical protein
MLFSEIIFFYSENHKKPTNKIWGQNASVLNVKADDSIVIIILYRDGGTC